MLLRRVLCLLIGSLVLFADSGQTIYARTCVKSGTVTLALLKLKACENERACCTQKHHESHKQCGIRESDSKCCSVASAYVKQSFPTGKLKHLQLVPQQPALTYAPVVLQPVAITHTVTPFNNTAPVLRLCCTPAFIQIFRC